jgi:hypothetical protein
VLLVDPVQRKEQKDVDGGQGLSAMKEAISKNQTIDRFFPRFGEHRRLFPKLSKSFFSFVENHMVKQINSASHNVNINAELDKLSKYLDFETNIHPFLVFITTILILSFRQRIGTKLCRKRAKHFCDSTVSRVTILAETLALHHRKNAIHSPRNSNLRAKYHRVHSIEENLKHFISGLDSFELSEENITSPTKTHSTQSLKTSRTGQLSSSHSPLRLSPHTTLTTIRIRETLKHRK